jgi:SPP1 gp7 family putative phage head morphogenesis protein
MTSGFESSPLFSRAISAYEDAIDEQSVSGWNEFATEMANLLTLAWCEGAAEAMTAAGMPTRLPSRPSLKDCRRIIEMTDQEWSSLVRSSLDAAVEVASWEAGATADLSDKAADSRKIVVCRTNAARSAHQGQQYAAMIEAVISRVPLYRYTAMMDSRTRPTHRSMNGYFATPMTIETRSLATPCGFNCRCKWRPVPMAEAKRLGLIGRGGSVLAGALSRKNGRRETLISSNLFPDPGFK